MPIHRLEQISIEVDGQANASLTEHLLRMTITENASGLFLCEATFANFGPKDGRTDYLYFDRTVIEFGKSFVVKLGTSKMMEGAITAIAANFPQSTPPEVSVVVEDRLRDLRMNRRTRTFNDVTDSDVFTQIAIEHGLMPNVNVEGPTHKVLVQLNQSDLEFLRARACFANAELWVDGQTLNVATRGSQTGQTLSLQYGSQLQEFSVVADLSSQPTTVAASGWDTDIKSIVSFQATDAVISGELQGGISGASIVASKFGDRYESVLKDMPGNATEAQAAAEVYFRKVARRFLVGQGVAETDPRLRAGAHVTLYGIGALFSGRYYLSEVQHVFESAKGLRTKFIAESSSLGQTT
jgi:phage protein D